MAINETATVEVQVNGEQAKNELQSLEKYAASLKDRIADAYTAGDTKKMKELEKELKKTNSHLRTMRTNAVNIDEVMKNLSTSGPKELQKTLTAINKELGSGRIKRGSQEWREYQEKLKLVNAEIRKIKAEGVEAESFLSRMNNKLSKWGGMIASVAAALTGVTLAFSKMRKDSHAKEESADNLKALTGLDDQSIAWLTQQAEILSTTMDKSGLRVKQSSQEILDAYTLVGSAKPELLSDKEALNAVTIETMRLSNAAKMDLKESVDAVTLSMNQYGASADEAAKYTNVMAAGSKFGSVAVQSITAAVIKAGVSASGAGISIEQLVGTIETLGEKGIKDEVAGTGLKTFFLRLQTGADETNPKVVGLQTALKNLQKLSTQDILKRFGQEAYTVAQTLIDGTEKVDYYTKAVTGTNVAVEQAAINSDNAAAKTAQMKNQLKEAGIELMERLNPSVNLLGSYLTNIVKFMPPLIDFIQKYGKVIVYASAVVLAYIAAEKLQYFWVNKVKTATGEYIVIQKLKQFWDKAVAASTWLYIAATSALTGKTKQAKLAMQAFYLIIKANPFAFIASLVIAVAGAFYLLTRRLNETQRAQKLLNDVQGEANSQISAERQEVETLLKIAKDETLSKGERLKAITKLNKISPEYLGNLSLEKINTDEAKKSVDNYIQSILLLAEAESAKRRLTDTDTELDELKKEQNKYLKERETFAGAVKALPKNLAYLFTAGIAENTGESLKNSINELEQQRNLLKKIIEDTTRKSIENEASNGDVDGGGGPLDDDVKKTKIQELESDFSIAKARQTALYSIGKINKQEFDAFVTDSEMKLLDSKMNLYSEESKEYNDLLSQKYQMQIKQNQECSKEDVESIDKRTKEAKRAALDCYVEQIIDKNAFEEELLQIDYDAIEEKRNLYVKGSKEYEEYQKQLDELTYQDKLKRQQSYEEKIKEFRKEYQKKTANELMQEEINGWDIFYKDGALKEEEYQQIILSIKKKYAVKQGEEVGYGKNDEKYNKEIGGFVDQAKAKTGNVGNPETDSFFDSMFGNDAKLHAGIIDNLKLMEEEGVISHEQCLAAKAQADNEYYNELAKKAEVVYAQISGVMSSYSSYVSACQDVETAKIEKKYDKEIAAAGKNSTKVAKLEDAKEKEIAKVKTKYNKKKTTMQIAQALAETAMGALNAYNAAWELGPVLGPILGPVFAGMAIGAGMLQVATIKKQAQAQESGYYQGGFTSPGNWNEEKGTVHAGEFVANRYAVRNKEILPVLRLIDNAQKNNTIGSLRASDVSMALDKNNSHTPGANTSVASSGDNAGAGLELISNSLDRASGIMEQLSFILEGGIESYVTIDGERGFEKQYNHYKKLKSNKSR